MYRFTFTTNEKLDAFPFRISLNINHWLRMFMSLFNPTPPKYACYNRTSFDDTVYSIIVGFHDYLIWNDLVMHFNHCIISKCILSMLQLFQGNFKFIYVSQKKFNITSHWFMKINFSIKLDNIYTKQIHTFMCCPLKHFQIFICCVDDHVVC